MWLQLCLWRGFWNLSNNDIAAAIVAVDRKLKSWTSLFIDVVDYPVREVKSLSMADDIFMAAILKSAI
jgi:hypothetical protein